MQQYSKDVPGGCNILWKKYAAVQGLPSWLKYSVFILDEA